MKVTSPSSAGLPMTHEFRVEPEYRTKADAKVAVACLAAEQGMFELLRFGGRPPPAGYRCFWSLHNEPTTTLPKRKGTGDDDDTLDNRKNKKRKMELTDSQEAKGDPGGSPTFTCPTEIRYSATNDDGKVQKGPRERPCPSGSSGLVPLGIPGKAGGSTGQNQYGNRRVGNSTAQYGAPHFSQFGVAGPSIPFHLYPPLPAGRPDDGSGYALPYHLVPQPATGPSQQQLYPFTPGHYAGGMMHGVPPHANAPHPNYVQGHGVLPPPVPYSTYPPQYPIHYPSFPVSGPYWCPNYSSPLLDMPPPHPSSVLQTAVLSTNAPPLGSNPTPNKTAEKSRAMKSRRRRQLKHGKGLVHGAC